MSRSQPDSSRKLEGGLGGNQLPETDVTSTAGQLSGTFLPGVRDTGRNDEHWLMTARQCYQASTDFFDANLRRKIEDSMALYRSEHPKGSKYHLPAYQKRSRLFRPKTRSSMRKKEAGIARAFFSTSDIVTITPPNPGDPSQRLAASIQEEVLNLRLRDSMNWFATVIGAFQDASRQGFVVSRTDWDFQTGTRYYTSADEMGNQVRQTEPTVVRDAPKVTLIPAENLRVDPACDWRDPINSSSYIIELMPMSVAEVDAMRNQEASPYQWRQVDTAALLGGLKQEMDSVRSAREGGRTDRYDQTVGINEFETVWIHRNIVRVEGEDYIFLTVGTEIMLTEPQPLSEIDPRGYRGYEWGWTVLESHNPYPDGDVQLGKPVQEEINDLANMRGDAIRMAMMGRYFVRRNSSVDTQALVRPVAGSAVEMSNPNGDVKWERPQEVGRTSYEEHNLLNTEMDDLLGNFASGSVAQNRQLNETVGGMNLIADNANEVSEFTARTFAETWMQKVLKHTVDLICLWETDQTIAKVVGDKLDANVEEVFRALKSPMGVQVNVGFGSTNPESRVRRLQTGLGVIQALAPELMMQSNQAEIAGEVMGALGYPDASRFFPSLGGQEDPQVTQLKEQLAQAQAMLEGKQMEFASREKIATIQAEARIRTEEIKGANATQLQQLKHEWEVIRLQAENEIKLIDLRIKFEQNEHKKMELYMQREALSHTIQMAEREFALKVQATALAPPPHADVPQPQGVAGLVEQLRKPSSSSVNLNDGITQGDIGGDTDAGVIARGDYGNIPGMEG